MKANELRVGNCLYSADRGIATVDIDIDGIFLARTEQRGPVSLRECSPMPLTEENILTLREVYMPDFKRIAFGQREPGERQIEFQYWSNWINEDNKLHLCPSYDYMPDENRNRVKSELPKFWFCWLQGGTWHLSLKAIRGNNTLQYVHQLQNLWLELSGNELIF